MIHESDLAPRGAEGLGVTQIEHFVPVSRSEKSRNQFENCYYCCRFCNQSRGPAPVVGRSGERLLNPCETEWAERFQQCEDRFEPREGDADAAYTLAVYRLNDLRKVEMRRFRRETISECRALLEGGRVLLERLLDRAMEEGNPELVEEAGVLADAMRRARRDLEVFAAVPLDAEIPCACGEELCRLPEALGEQLQDL